MSENLPIAAQSVESDLRMAQILLKGGLLPAHFKTVEAVVTAVWYGRELGMSPIRAIQSINVIQGKPTLDAQALKAIAIQNGGKFKTIEWTAEKCAIEASRGDWVETNTFTIGDAQLQGLAGKDNWKRMPKAMLYARCVTILIRNMFADVIGGLYGREEMEDAINVTPQATVEPPKPAQVALPETVKIADEIPPNTRYYMIADLEPEKTKLALQRLEQAGAKKVNDFGMWESPKRIKLLDNYDVTDIEGEGNYEEANI